MWWRIWRWDLSWKREPGPANTLTSAQRYWFWISGFQNSGRIHSVVLSHHVSGHLSQQPQETNTVMKKAKGLEAKQGHPHSSAVREHVVCSPSPSSYCLEAASYPLDLSLHVQWASLVAQIVKSPPAMQETWVRFLDGEDPPEKGIATHSSILAWRIPWIEEPGGLPVHGVTKSRTQLRH